MMKFETKIVTLLMCVALSLLSSCNKKLPDTPVQEQQVPVGFRAMSQAVWVKSGETMFPYDDFGVWGIARQGSNIYNLWGNDGLLKVEDLEHRVANNITTSTTQRVFTPTEAAYWIRDYDYNFLALAPYNPTGLSNVNFTLADATGNTTGKDYMTFTYDMSSKYSGNIYDFDLLGAAAQSGPVAGGRTDSQQLMFWHLFSQININVVFTNDLEGKQITGEVTGIRLENVVSKGTYQMSHNTNNTLTALCTPSTVSTDKKTLTFGSSPALFHIIPQDVTTMGLYLNFKINEGTADTPVWATYNDFHISLNVDGNANPYEANGRYNWKIKIGTGAAIKFEVVKVNPWENVNGGEITM